MKNKTPARKLKEKKFAEPDWLNDDPNQKPVKYSEKDLDNFADGFIQSNKDVPAVKELIDKIGLIAAKNKIKEAMQSKKKIEEIMKEIH